MRLACLVVAAVLVIPSFASAQGTPAIVDGTVLDGATRKPIPGASVRADSLGNVTEVLTDSQGRFGLWNLPNGRNRITVCRNGYVCTFGSVCVAPDVKINLRLYTYRHVGGSVMGGVMSRRT